MEMDSNTLKEYVLFQLERKIVNLYKSFLFTLEDVKNQKFDLSNPNVYALTRKRVLDLSNDTLRELEQHFEKLEINLKSE